MLVVVSNHDRLVHLLVLKVCARNPPSSMIDDSRVSHPMTRQEKGINCNRLESFL